MGFGAAGLVVFSQAGEEGGGGYALLVLGSILLTAAFLALAALLAAGAVGRSRVRALALAVVVWFVAVVLFDLAALGAASLLPSGTASRLLVVAVIVNPVGRGAGRAPSSRSRGPPPSAPPPSPSCASRAAAPAPRRRSPPRSPSGSWCPAALAARRLERLDL